MRTSKYFLITAFVFACVAIQAFADVAPDPGYKRIQLKLILESNEDVSDHRFFLKLGSEAKEIVIQRGSPITIEPQGGGAYYRHGTVIAIPKDALKGFEGTDGDVMEKAIYENRVPGAMELVRHSFAREVPQAESSGWTDPVYRIERVGSALKAIHVSGGANNGKANNAAGSGLAFWRSSGAGIVAGIFLLFGIAMLGILYFRKRAKLT